MAKRNEAIVETAQTAVTESEPVKAAAPSAVQVPPSDLPDGVSVSERVETGGSVPEKIAVTLRHKTEYPQYRRAGLVLKQTPAEFRVTVEELDLLKKDPCIEVCK